MGGLTLVQVPQAVVGFPVELFHTCWPCGGVEDVPLLVPGGLVMSRQLTLHVQVGLGCRGGGRHIGSDKVEKNKKPLHISSRHRENFGFSYRFSSPLCQLWNFSLFFSSSLYFPPQEQCNRSELFGRRDSLIYQS